MKRFLERIVSGNDLTTAEATDLFEAMIQPDAPGELVAAVLASLRSKGECPDEVRGFADAMRANAVTPAIDTRECIDIVGTGGDGSGSLNLSTGVSLLAAAAGLPVVKHGNSSVSSKSGSADALRELGVYIPIGSKEAGRLFSATGFTFLFAPHFHRAMASLAPTRKALGIRTIFNILGPLTNPARPKFNIIGAFSMSVAELMADALSGMEIERTFVIHGAAGWDEPTPIGPFELFDVTPGKVNRTTRDPLDYGIPRCEPRDLAGGDATRNAAELIKVFGGSDGHHSNTLQLGAALAMEVMGVAPSIEEGLERAQATIDAGTAQGFLGRLRQYTPATERDGTRV